MSRLNTMYPNDDFLKNISNMFGKIDSRNETEIKQEIEQIGYKEFYRYYKEKDIRINLLKDRIDKAIEYIENNSLYEEEYDYDYEENIYLSGINDETARKDLLAILGGKE